VSIVAGNGFRGLLTTEIYAEGDPGKRLKEVIREIGLSIAAGTAPGKMDQGYLRREKV
jgi:hypothetical protein